MGHLVLLYTPTVSCTVHSPGSGCYILCILPSFHSSLESTLMSQTWLKYSFRDLWFSKEDERDLVKEDEWVDGLRKVDF